MKQLKEMLNSSTNLVIRNHNFTLLLDMLISMANNRKLSIRDRRKANEVLQLLRHYVTY